MDIRKLLFPNFKNETFVTALYFMIWTNEQVICDLTNKSPTKITEKLLTKLKIPKI